MIKLVNKMGMMSESKKSGIAYTLSTLVTKGLVFLTIPVFTRIMPSAEIGKINLYNSWFSLICIFSTLSLTSGGYQLALKEFDNDKDRYESSVYSLTLLVTSFVTVLYVMNTGFWEKMFGLSRAYMIMLVIGLFLTPAQDFWMARQRYDYKYKMSSFLTLISTFGAVVLSVFAVLNCKPNETGWARLFVNNLVIYSVALLLGINILKKGKCFYKKEYWAFSLSLSLPLVGHAIAKQILDVSDRIMINQYIGSSAVGIYGTLYSVSSISLIAWNAMNGAYVPYLFKNIDNIDEHNNIRRTSSTLLTLYTFIAFVMILLAPEIVRIMATQEYYEAVYIMPPIAMGVALTAVSNLYSNILIFYKKTKVIMLASGAASVVNLVLNYIFIPRFGYQAAAYTTLVAYIIMALIEAVVATRYYKNHTKLKMIYDNKLIFILCVITVLLSFISIFLYGAKIPRYLVCIVCLLATYVLYKKKLKTKD